uniref:Mitochondrial ribosomal protein S18C n=1 Tax=Cairina moschata TaxID=8855 RepID=A0A8C3CDT7_CAIMO
RSPCTGLCAGVPSPPMLALLTASGEQAALGPAGGRLRLRACKLIYLQHCSLLIIVYLQPVEMENPYKEPPKKCVLCGIKVDYKNVQVSVTGLCLCNKKQKEISKTIKRAQVLGFMPVMFKNTAFLTDPKICNIKY